jgi:hypothetical protein
MAQIWAQVYQGMRTLARGGLEVGGLLVGPKADAGRVIDGIIPLPIEYRQGPSFQMSSSDLDSVALAVESVQGDPLKTVVGLYRSRTRGDGTLRESDYEILDTIEQAHLSFVSDFRCCFVLAPMSESLALACIALRSGDGWDEMHPFTLGSDLVSIGTLPSATGLLQRPRSPGKEPRSMDSRVSSLPNVDPVTDESVREQRAASLAVGGRSVWRARIWLYAAACLALAGGVAGAYRWTMRKQPQPMGSVRTQIDASQAHLGFSATLQGSVWKLAWDRAVMATLNPIAAVLSIEDGGSSQEVRLALADLTSGTILYSPQSSNLTFGLRIDSGREQIEERVRILGAPSIAQTPIPQTPIAQTQVEKVPQSAPKALVQEAPTRGVTRPSKQVHTLPPVTVPVTSADLKPKSSIPGTVPSKEPILASTTGRDVKSAPTPVPSSTAAAIAVPVLPLVEKRENPGPTPEPFAKPASDMTPSRIAIDQQTVTLPAAGAVSPAQGAGTSVARDANEIKGTADNLVPILSPATPNASARANYVGPKPIRQVRPQVPGNMPSGVSQVQVQVEIDSHGKVVKVTPVGWTATNAPLMVLAERAAASWVFDAAQLNGHAVSSQMHLTFQFRF